MIEKYIEDIRAGEKDAGERLAEAAKSAEGLIDKARKDGEKLLEETKIDGAELKKELIAKAHRNAEEKIKKIREENAKALAACGEAAKSRRNETVGIIIETFRKGL